MYKLRLILKKCKLGKRIKFEEKNNVFIDKFVSIGANSIISGYAGGKLHINKGVVICSNCKIATCGGNIEIEENTQIGDNCVITGQGGVHIGKNVLMADRINIIANQHIYEDIRTPIMKQGERPKGISIGSGCWIGINSTILSGVSIGENCVIGANTVVSKDIPNYCVVAGVPGKIIKIYNEETKMWNKVE